MSAAEPTWGRLENAERATKPDASESPKAALAVTPEVTPGLPPVAPTRGLRELVKSVVETLGNGTANETRWGMRDGPPPAPYEPARRWRRVTPWALRRSRA